LTSSLAHIFFADDPIVIKSIPGESYGLGLQSKSMVSYRREGNTMNSKEFGSYGFFFVLEESNTRIMDFEGRILRILPRSSGRIACRMSEVRRSRK